MCYCISTVSSVVDIVTISIEFKTPLRLFFIKATSNKSSNFFMLMKSFGDFEGNYNIITVLSILARLFQIALSLGELHQLLTFSLIQLAIKIPSIL